MLIKKYHDGDFVGYEEVPDPEPVKEIPQPKKTIAEKVVEAVKPKAKEKK